jgi:hypothetical protein
MSTAHVPTLDEARVRIFDELPSDSDGSENAGFVVVGTADGHDVLLWCAAYALTGRGAGQWIVPDGRMNGTLFIAVPPERQGAGLWDNNFVRSGTHFSQLLPAQAHEIVEHEGTVTWRLAGREYTWDPPRWVLRGSHAGVDLDLTFVATAPAHWAWGPWDGLRTDHSAGYEVRTRADGTISVGGRTFRLENAAGFHERPAVGEQRDVVNELKGGIEFTALQMYTDSLRVNINKHSGKNVDMGQIIVGDRELVFSSLQGAGTASLDILERWTDPRSGLSVPSRWHAALVSGEAVLDIDIQAEGRGYFHYLTSTGVMIIVWLLARANGEMVMASGERHAIDDALVAARWGRNLLVAAERLTSDGT